jgi:quinol monooxygenase YgiN
MTSAIEWIKNNEPGTLEFSVYEEIGEEGTKLIMVERYALRAIAASFVV